MRRPSREQLAHRWIAASALIVVVGVLVTWGVAVRWAGRGDDRPAAPVSTAPTTDPPATTADAPPTTALTSTGRFLPDPGAPGPVVGDGPIRTYRVEVEEGTGVAPADFAADVERILSDPRGWTTADGLALQRVTDPDAAEITVTLATPAMVDVLCHPLDTDGDVSCAQVAHAVINARRWHDGAEPSGLDLAAYRAYVVSHEVGHTLGHDHVECPAPGHPAPVMVQQTLGIGACTPNPWPAPDARAG